MSLLPDDIKEQIKDNVDYIFSPPKLIRHECIQKPQYTTIGKFPGHSGWFVDSRGVMVQGLTYCPYCGILLNEVERENAK